MTTRQKSGRRSAVSSARVAANAERRLRSGKRPLTEAELRQRREAAPKGLAAGALAGKSTGPITEDGKAVSSRNAWKHGRYSAINRAQFGIGAASVSRMFGKPCQTTCPFHPDNPDRTEAPCSLVLDGLTHAGGSCLDKTVYVHALQGLMEAMQNGEMDGVHGLLATEMASTLQLMQKIREEISERGVVVEVPVVTKDGKVVIDESTGRPYASEVKANPVLAHLISLMDRMGINFGELMATPKARERLREDDDAADSFQRVMGAIFSRASNRLPAKRVIENGSDDDA